MIAVAVAAITAPASIDASESVQFRVVGVENNDVLNVRQHPSSDAPIIGMLAPGTVDIVYFGEAVGDWRLIGHGQLRGWAHSRYLQKTSVAGWIGAPALRVVGVARNDVLNIRAHPNADAAIVGMFSPNERCIFSLEQRVGDWVLVERGNDDARTRGWIHARFLAVDLAANPAECH